MAASRYTFLACDQISGQVRERIRLLDVDANLALDFTKPGSFEAKMSLAGRNAVTRAAWLDATEPGRSTVVIVRDGVALGEWIIRGRPTRKNDASPVELYGEQITGYFADVPPNFSNAAGDLPLAGWTNVDQLTIAAALVQQCDDPITNTLAPAGSRGMNLTVPAVTPSGQLVTKAEWASQYLYVQAMLAELAQAAAPAGFELTITVQVVANVVQRTVKFGYPQLGIDSGTALQPAEGKPGGNATEVNCPDDGTRLATQVIGLGKGQGVGKTVTYSANAGLVALYPYRAKVVSNLAVADPVALQALSDDAASKASSSAVPPSVSVFADRDPVLGSYSPGDTFTLAMGQSTNFPNGNRVKVRLTGIQIKPPAAGPELVPLTVTAL